MYQASHELLNFGRQRLPRGHVQEFLAQALALQRLTAIRVRRAPRRVIPRGITAVADRLARLVPRPQLDQRMHPGPDVERPHVGPDVPHLLLPDPLPSTEVPDMSPTTIMRCRLGETARGRGR